MRAPPGVRACTQGYTPARAIRPVLGRAGGLEAMSSALAVRSSIPPAPAAATIVRPRLLATLDAHRGGAFTLVSAPPGWGKSGC